MNPYLFLLSLVEKFNFKIITDPADLMKFVQHLKESNRKVDLTANANKLALATFCFLYVC